jgi:hypothetical protein
MPRRTATSVPELPEMPVLCAISFEIRDLRGQTTFGGKRYAYYMAIESDAESQRIIY